MKQWTVTFIDAPGMSRIRGDKNRRTAHIAFVRARSELQIGGPLAMAPMQDFPGAIWTVQAETRADVERLILSDPYWGNYAKVWGDRLLRSYMLNSVIISTGNAVVCTVLGFFACYALSRFKMAGKESLFFWTITNRMAPPAVFLLPLFLLMTQVYAVGDFRLLDTRIGMILVYCTFNLPFAIWTLRPTLDGIPKELDEAAYVDGA